MIKKYKGFIITTTLITLLPMFVGFYLWNQLPDRIATHFNFSGEPDGYSSKLVAVVGIYLFCAAMHLFCAFVTAADPRQKQISSKIYHLILCICPLVSLYAGFIIYGSVLGYNALPFDFLTNTFIGILLIALGNYLPKCRQNYTIGFRLPWTLADEATWDYTHRIAGKWMVAGGILIVLLGFQHLVDSLIAAFIVLAVVTIVPSVASYLYYSGKIR